jgi:hypothetical protein
MTLKKAQSEHETGALVVAGFSYRTTHTMPFIPISDVSFARTAGNQSFCPGSLSTFPNISRRRCQSVSCGRLDVEGSRPEWNGVIAWTKVTWDLSDKLTLKPGIK